MTLNLPSLYFSDQKSMARPAQIKTNHQTFDTKQASQSAVFLGNGNTIILMNIISNIQILHKIHRHRFCFFYFQQNRYHNEEVHMLIDSSHSICFYLYMKLNLFLKSLAQCKIYYAFNPGLDDHLTNEKKCLLWCNMYAPFSYISSFYFYSLDGYVLVCHLEKN